MAHRVRPGDVIEIPTSRGFGYAQCTHQSKEWGSLIRVLPGLFVERPASLREIVGREAKFVVFFPLQQAVSQRIFDVIAHEEIPEEARQFPVFRSPGIRLPNGQVSAWWLWDGRREWRVGELTPEYQRLPIREAWNDTLLIERIEQDWRPGGE